MKNPLTLAGIEPAFFRFVAQHLNHCATATCCLDSIYLHEQGREGFVVIFRSQKGSDNKKTLGKNGLQNLTKQILAGHDSILGNNIY